MTEILVVYHGGCRDGFASAWVINKYFDGYLSKHVPIKDKVTYHPGFYGQEPPDVTGKDVIIVDFCYPLDVMLKIVTNCKSFTWLDHHKTAQPIADYFDQHHIYGSNVKYEFDIERSGAGIAWDYFFSNEARPWIVDYVEDRDLWLKALPNSDRVNAYIACIEFRFEVWELVNIGISLEEAITFGDVAQKKTEQYVREVCKNAYFVNMSWPQTIEDMKKAEGMILNWKNIPTVNICQVDCSEVLHELCNMYPKSQFSLYWFKRADGMYQYGLRSIGNFDVSEIAKLFGGGGHHNAAGFQLEYLLEELK